MRPTLDDEWDLEPWDDDPDGVDAHDIRESSEPEPRIPVAGHAAGKSPDDTRPCFLPGTYELYDPAYGRSPRPDRRGSNR